MATENLQLSTNIGTGDVLRSLFDSNGAEYVAGLCAFPTVNGGGSTSTISIVSPTAGLPVQPQTSSTWAVTDNSGSLTVDAPVGTPVFVRLSDGSAAITTLPVSAASLPLPTGAATAAKQPALGTAGTASADVLSVQGRAGMTALVVDGSAVTQPVSIAGTVQVDIASISASLEVTAPGGLELAHESGGNLAAAAASLSTIDDLVLHEDAVAASGDPGVQLLAVRANSPANTSNTNGDYEPLQVNAGRLWCSATIDAALPAGTNGIGKLTSNSGVTIGAVEIAAAQTLSTVTTVGTVTTCSTVTSLSQFAGNAISTGNGASGTGVLRVTMANDSTGILAGVTTVTTLTGGGVAHDGVDSGNPHLIGAHATTSVKGGTNVADADRTYLKAGIDGVLITRPHCNLEDIVTGNATNTDGTSTACIAAQAAGVKTYLTTIVLANSHATTNCTVDIKDGSTVKMSVPVPANGGAVINLLVPIPGSAATAWNFDPSAAVTTISCSMVGFVSKV